MASEGGSVSIVVPVYNERESLPLLFAALDEVAPRIGGAVEYVLVDDGSTDDSRELLEGFRSAVAAVQVVELAVNFGQHAAVMAGLANAGGDVVVTLDADMQNPPGDIPALVAQVREGYDVAAGWRRNRRDPLSRRIVSLLMNRAVGKATGHYLHDYGCMLRAYSRRVVDAIVQCREHRTFIPVLANSFASSVTEVEVGHAERAAGASKYSWAALWRLNADLFIGLTTLPLQYVSLAGVIVALMSLGFGAYLMLRRFVVGAEVEGVFTLFAVLFFFIGVQILAVGMIGEFLVRIYEEVRNRPVYLVRRVLRSAPTGGER